MITFMEPKENVKEVEKCLDPQLWHACAGGMVQMPEVNSKVVYFPQGHAEHACGPVDFRGLRSPPYVLCRVAAIKFMADPETDEVFAKTRLVPVNGDELGSLDEVECLINGREVKENKPASFAKTLTQSDANNGGGFSVPRYCAETIFPRLDYSADPPVQTILAKDVHGEMWKFRHIYRGTPRRHLLTTGWSTFVNHKKLVAGDSIVFLRADNGDLCVGIRRAKRGIGGGPEPSQNPAGGNCIVPYGGFAGFMRENENKFMRNGNGTVLSSNGGMIERRRVTPDSVIEAAMLAAKGQPFEVVYYPRASTPEFCVKASLVKAALQIRWSSGMRFKMPFETEDSSRISWFMGTISSVQVADPLRWPESPWRLLQVNWDEPDLLQNVKRVSPWLVELVSNMPAIHLSPFSPPRKKLKLPHDPNFDGQFPLPTFSGNVLGAGSPFRCLPDNSPAGMQGARHDHYSLPLPDLHLHKMHAGLFLAGFPPLLDHSATYKGVSNGPVFSKPTTNESVSGVPTMSHSALTSKKPDDTKAGQFVLFGKPILTEQQISLSFSGDAASPVRTGNSSSDGNLEKMGTVSDVSGSDLQQQCHPDGPKCEGFKSYVNNCKETDTPLDIGPCKVYLDSEDSGRTLDLSVLGSYEELNRKLADMFGIENFGSHSNLIYRDDTDAVKHVGDEQFGDFIKAARRLTIPMESSSNNACRCAEEANKP